MSQVLRKRSRKLVKPPQLVTPPPYVCPVCGCYEEKQIEACNVSICPKGGKQPFTDTPIDAAVANKKPAEPQYGFWAGAVIGFLVALMLVGLYVATMPWTQP